MPLVPFSQLLADARRGGYAVAYFEPWDEASLLAILRGAEQARAPIMVGQSGIYLPPALGMDQRFFPAYARAGRLAAEAATVPVAYLFNETPYWDWAQAALGLGFNVVMYSNSADDPETHVARTAELVRLGAEVGVEVESEVGSLLGGELENTEPQVAAEFARRTGVHALGITAGNRHLASGKYQLDLDLIARLAGAVPVPLVLHGGSGAQDGELREAAQRGVGQVNYGTVQRLVFLERLETALAEDWRGRDPHELLGTGLPADVMREALEAVSALVAEKCGALGAEGRA
jgi:fructose/tagatose bisphosphate aldolase